VSRVSCLVSRVVDLLGPSVVGIVIVLLLLSSGVALLHYR
jgi:hypothetical protein